MSYSKECEMCGGEMQPLGNLGNLMHYRCRQCGWEDSDNIEDNDDYENDFELSEEQEREVRKYVREFLLKGGNIKEYDALFSKKKDWENTKKEMKREMMDLLLNIENDEYQEGIRKIDDVIQKLRDWKSRIEKHL